jgi:hypothetical protein
METTPKQQPLVSWRHLIAPITRRAEVFVSGRFWIIEVCFLATLFSMLFTGGVDEILYDLRVKYDAGYFLKIEHPLADVSKQFPASRHEAKLNFRLTVPVILHWLPVPVREWWFLPGLTVCAICSLLGLCCLFTYRITGDRVCGLWTTLGVASTYIGTFYTTRYYDAIAICQLLIAMLPGVHWSARGLMVFTAAFTDERAFVAAPLLLFADTTGRPMNGWRHMTRPSSLAVIGGMAGYCLVRLLLEKYAGLGSPMGGVGLQTLALNARYWHSGVWFALGGGWLLVGLSMLSLRQEGRKLELWMFACAIAAPIFVGLMVLDVVRSTAYALPAVLVALTVLSRRETKARLKVWCLAAFVLSAVAADFCVFPNPWHSPPLVVKWFSEMIPQAVIPADGIPPR